MYLWQRKTGRKLPMVQFPHELEQARQSGFVPADDLINTADGMLCAFALEPAVENGRAIAVALEKRRAKGEMRLPTFGEEAVPVFMRPEDYARLSEDEKAALRVDLRPNAPKRVMVPPAEPKGERRAR